MRSNFRLVSGWSFSGLSDLNIFFKDYIDLMKVPDLGKSKKHKIHVPKKSPNEEEE